MIYAKIENPEQEKRLIDELKTSKDKNWYRRLEIITNSTKGATVEQLSKTFNVSQATIRRYIHAFNKGGLDALKPIKPIGRSKLRVGSPDPDYVVKRKSVEEFRNLLRRGS